MMKAAFIIYRSSSYLARAKPIANACGLVGYRAFAPKKLISRALRPLSSGTEFQEKKEGAEFADVPGVKAAGDKMVIMFTCTVCDTRSARKISKRAYSEGIVMVRCSGCNNRHLIADRMGVFEDSIPSTDGSAKVGEGWDIQKYLSKEMGTTSKYITDENVYELNMQDIIGAKAAAALLENEVADASKEIK